MATLAAKLDLVLEVITCGACGVVFGMSEHHVTSLRSSHQTFYCPNGHPRAWTGKSTEEKLREQLAAAEAARVAAVKREEWAKQAAKKSDDEANLYLGKLSKLKHRVARGICPCCKRTVAQLAKHMATKHPTFPSEPQP